MCFLFTSFLHPQPQSSRRPAMQPSRETNEQHEEPCDEKQKNRLRRRLRPRRLQRRRLRARRTSPRSSGITGSARASGSEFRAPEERSGRLPRRRRSSGARKASLSLLLRCFLAFVSIAFHCAPRLTKTVCTRERSPIPAAPFSGPTSGPGPFLGFL